MIGPLPGGTGRFRHRPGRGPVKGVTLMGPGAERIRVPETSGVVVLVLFGPAPGFLQMLFQFRFGIPAPVADGP